MSRDYLPVVDKGGKLRFAAGKSFNSNVWGNQFWGRVFQLLNLPISSLSHTLPNDPPMLKHQFTPDDMVVIRSFLQQPDYMADTMVAIAGALDELGSDAPKDVDLKTWTEDLDQDFFEMFRDPATVVVASDYCEQFYGD